MNNFLNRREMMWKNAKGAPYNPTVTGLLKSTFPAYWTAISEYGRLNPEIVPFVNEDPYVIANLMDCGMLRWLKSTNAYLNTGVCANGNLTLHMQVLYYEAQSGYTCTWGGENGTNTFSMFRSGGTNGYFHCNGSDRLAATINTAWDVRVTPTAFIIDGSPRMTYTQGTHNYPIYLFQIMRGGSVGGYDIQKSCMSIFEIFDGDTQVRKLVPFTLGASREAAQVSTGVPQEAGAVGMMDVLSGIFYPNANSSGSFSIVTE